MKKWLIICLMFGVIFTSQGCATVLKGTNESIKFNTNPSGAKVKLGNEFVGTTPVDVKVKCNLIYAVEITKDGYNNKVFLTPVSDSGAWGWFFLNLVTNGCILGLIDVVNGAYYSHPEKEYNINLEEKAKP